jgi:hypothetical protein
MARARPALRNEETAAPKDATLIADASSVGGA